MAVKVEEQTLNSYGHTFTVKIICSLLTDVSFIGRVFDILKPEYFDNTSFKWIVNEILQHYLDYKCIPTMDVLKVKVNNLSGTEKTLVIKTLKEAYQVAESSDLEFIKEKVIEFCRNQELKNAILESADLLQYNRFDEIKKKIDNALVKGMDTDIGHTYETDVDVRYTESKREPISTGWTVIDEITGGGLAPGELGVIMAPAGIGKSFLLICLGLAAKRLGKRVVHYTLELNESYVAIRYDAMITGISMDNLQYHIGDIKTKIEKVPGELIIKWYPTKSITLIGIKAHINKLIMLGKRPDLIVIDYADLLKTTGNEKKHEALQDLYEEIRGMAGEYQVPIWTASQSNRSGATEDIVTGDNISESFGKLMTADFLMSMSRKTKDKLSGTGRGHIIKNRFGPDGLIFPMKIDTTVGSFEFFAPKSEIGQEVQQQMKTDAQYDKMYMKKKYTDYLNKPKTEDDI